VDEPPREIAIAAHVEAIATQTHRSGTHLAYALARRSWPSGSADRLDHVGVAWVKRRGLVQTPVAPIECTCATGRCLVCN
jgi:hypothetical protein